MSYNSKPISSFIDDSFKTEELEHTTLCVGLGASRISMVLFGADNEKVVFFTSLKPAISGRPGSMVFQELYKDALKLITEKQDLDFTRAGTIKVYTETDHYSLIPESLYRPEEKQAYLDLNQELYNDNEFELRQNPVSPFKLINVFAIPAQEIESIEKLFPGASIMHHLSVLLNQLDKDGFYVYLGSNNLDLIYINEGLRLCQTFPYESAEDVLYHITHISGRLGIGRQDYPFTVLGEINEGSDGYKMIREYFSKLSLIDFKAETGFIKDHDAIQPHHLYTLFSLKNCE
jgi:hypothetical protein